MRWPGVPDGLMLIPEKRRLNRIGQEARGGEWEKGNENCTRVTKPALGGQDWPDWCGGEGLVSRTDSLFADGGAVGRSKGPFKTAHQCTRGAWARHVRGNKEFWDCVWV